MLPDLDIGFDYGGKDAEYIFISHAHSDHTPGGKKRSTPVFATPATASLMQKRGFTGPVNELSFGEPMETDRARITFYPAGHILGSAMTFVESDEGTVLYTGDFRYPSAPSTEGFECPDNVDYLITEATFGLPIYRWESHEVLFEQIRNFARSSLDAGYTPVFLAYSLGKSQEIMHALAPLNHTIQIHGAGYKLCPVYEEHGVDLGTYETYDRESAEGKILLTPSSGLSNGFASNINKKRIAYCSGWASLESRRSQLTAHKLIPLSDHIDFFELINLCEKLDPKKVLITHTPNPDVLQHYLETRGIRSTFLDLEVETDG